ncbi:hypothetical protein K2X89_01775 [Myxococcota bacterium]|nr:hypothetical protein [Myxococcota bacterium]
MDPNAIEVRASADQEVARRASRGDRRRRTPPLELLATALLWLVFPQAAWAVQPVFDLVRLPGLTDAEHTDAQGHHISSARMLDGTGLVFGRSKRVPFAASGPGVLGTTGWVYDPIAAVTTRAALDTVPYAPIDQVCTNGVVETTALGFGIGSTSCDSPPFRSDLWAFDSHDRVKTFLGLSDPAHVSPIDGRPFTLLLPYAKGRISSSGHVTGTTTRWIPAQGESAWLYDSTTRATVRIGLLDAEHTAPDGAQESTPLLLSRAGNVAGYSARYVAGAFVGRSAWIHPPAAGVTRRVGLYDGDGRGSQGFTASDGSQESTIASLTASAHAAGHSTRFQGTDRKGLVAWRYRVADDSMIRIGLSDPMHTRADGERESAVIAASDAGHVLGSSTRYDGGTDPLTVTQWLFDAQSLATKAIGLFDPAHTDAEGLQSNRAHALSESGHVAGSAIRLGSSIPGNSPGNSVWIAHHSLPATKRIGLIDGATLGAASFTSTSGDQASEFGALLESGDVLGSSLAYQADQPIGSAVWYYDASDGTTRPIGLYGPRFTAPDGSFSSSATRWTETGFVAGSSAKPDQFQALWIYSAQTRENHEIVPPRPAAPGGFIVPEILFLSDDGGVVGQYTYFDGLSPDGIVRFFAWTPSGGTVFLDERIANGFRASGWIGIETITAVHDDRILGSGRRANGDVDGFMLVPLPEPNQTTIVSIGLIAGAWQVARRNRWPHLTPRSPAPCSGST